MIQEITQSQFKDAFIKMGRKDNFSFEGLSVLYDFLNGAYEGTDQEYKLDVIALCCDFTEYESFEDFKKDYGQSYQSIEDLENDTQVLMIDQQRFIIQNF